MNIKILNEIAVQMVADSKGILAMDESNGTIKKRFDALRLNQMRIIEEYTEICL